MCILNPVQNCFSVSPVIPPLPPTCPEITPQAAMQLPVNQPLLPLQSPLPGSPTGRLTPVIVLILLFSVHPPSLRGCEFKSAASLWLTTRPCIMIKTNCGQPVSGFLHEFTTFCYLPTYLPTIQLHLTATSWADLAVCSLPWVAWVSPWVAELEICDFDMCMFSC